MFGAIYGDVIGSYYEHHCTKNYDFEFARDSTFTDDSVLTTAVCKAILIDHLDISTFQIHRRAYEYAAQYRQFYSYFQNSGFGEMFMQWAKNGGVNKQRSYGNGAAMRVVPIGYAYQTIEQVLLQAKASCMITHNSKEAITGAQAVATAVWLASQNESKIQIRNYLEKRFKYDLSKSINTIRPDYVFDSRTSYSVPPAIIAFLDSDDYESAVRNAVSLGGDADTMACISGGIAEAYYKVIPEHIKQFCDKRIDISIKMIVREFNQKFAHV